VFYEPFRRDANLLGSYVLENLRAQPKGETIHAKVNRLINISRRYRQAATEPNFREMLQLVEKLDDFEAQQVSVALYEILSLTNLAEAQHRLRRRRAAKEGKAIMEYQHSVRDTFKELQAKGHSAEEIRNSLMKQQLEFVLTAHPTQATRRTLLNKYSEIAELLRVLDRSDLTPPQVSLIPCCCWSIEKKFIGNSCRIA
jgi:phosphoenolpyruvate carboxylase